MRPDLRKCYAGTPFVHYTWFAYDQTLCGLQRAFTIPFTSAPAACVVCIAAALAFPPSADLGTQITIARKIRRPDF